MNRLTSSPTTSACPSSRAAALGLEQAGVRDERREAPSVLGLERDEGLLRHTESLVKEWRTRIVVWTERDVEAPQEGKAPPVMPPSVPESREATPELPTETHWGKYKPLWAWLRNRPDDRVELTFTQIEEILGFPLPPSSRKHPPHWHSYKGSAVVRSTTRAGRQEA
jgi:hypothetical protein